MRSIHDKSWAVMRVSGEAFMRSNHQGWLSDIQCLGASPSIGLIEALLLLAENLPRDPNPGKQEDVHGAENRQAWMLIGTAIRCAYGLGIEKVRFESFTRGVGLMNQLAMKLLTEADRTPELERARLAWTCRLAVF